jgi:hypothetical protein
MCLVENMRYPIQGSVILSGGRRSTVFYSSEEVGLISGVISSYFSYPNVSESAKSKYCEVYNRLLQDELTVNDLAAIENALLFLAPFYRDSREDHHEIMSIAFKTAAMRKSL